MRNPNGIFHTVHMREDHIMVDNQKDYHTSWYWRLRDFTSSAAWDYYKINCVVMKFIPENNPTYPMAAHIECPSNYAWIDYDDEDVPTLVPYNRPGLRHWMGDKTFSIKIYPRVLTSAGQGSYKQNEITKPGWINTFYNDTHYLGLKTSFAQLIPVGTGNVKTGYKVLIKAYVSYMQPMFANK